MSIEPGAYLIQNVKHRNFAAQSAENKVEGYADTGMYPSSVPQNVRLNLRKLWSISRLDNDKYTIRNIETNDYAAVRNFSVIEENIITTEFMQPWDVKETGFKGRYVIYSTAASIDLYWGLTDGQLGTLISLRDKPNTPSNQWELQKVDLWPVVGELRKKLADLRLNKVMLGGVHMKFGDVHMNLGDVHPNLGDGHPNLGDGQSDLRDVHKKLWEEYKMLQDDYMKLSDDYAKLWDERATLRSTVARLNARHLQAEAELKEYYERLLAER